MKLTAKQQQLIDVLEDKDADARDVQIATWLVLEEVGAQRPRPRESAWARDAFDQASADVLEKLQAQQRGELVSWLYEKMPFGSFWEGELRIAFTNAKRDYFRKRVFVSSTSDADLDTVVSQGTTEGTAPSPEEILCERELVEENSTRQKALLKAVNSTLTNIQKFGLALSRDLGSVKEKYEGLPIEEVAYEIGLLARKFGVGDAFEITIKSRELLNRVGPVYKARNGALLSQKDIAELLGLNQTWVSRDLKKAREILREALTSTATVSDKGQESIRRKRA